MQIITYYESPRERFSHRRVVRMDSRGLIALVVLGSVL